MFKRYISKGKIDIMHYTTGIKLNRGPVAKNHSNLDWSHEHFQTIFEYFICEVNVWTSRIFVGLLELLFYGAQLATASFVPALDTYFIKSAV